MASLPADKNKKYTILKIIKSHPALNNPMIVLRYENKAEWLDSGDLLQMGVSYASLNGEELEKFFKEIAYLFLGSKTMGVMHATVKQLDIGVRFFHRVPLKELSQKEILLGSYVQFKPEEPYMFISEKKKFTSFTPLMVTEQKEVKPDHFYRYLTKVQFPKDSETTFDQITGFDEIWMNDKIATRKDKILIVSQDPDHYPFYSFHLTDLEIAFRMTSYDPSQLELVSSYKPDLIFIATQAVKSQNEAGQDIYNYEEFDRYLAALMEAIKNVPNYQPHVILLDHQTGTSDDYRNRFAYKRLVLSKHPIDAEKIKELILHFQSVVPQDLNNIKKFIPFNKSDVLVSSFMASLKSLSESTVTFSTNLTIPYFTILQIRSPFPFDILVIPPETQIESPGKGVMSYAGLIMNIDEKERMELRKLVNFMMKLEKEEKENFILLGHEEFKKLKEIRDERKLQEERMKQLEEINAKKNEKTKPQ